MTYLTIGSISFRINQYQHVRNRILGTEVTLTHNGTNITSCGKITAVSPDNTYIMACPVAMATGVNITDDVVEMTNDVNGNGIVINIAEVWVYQGTLPTIGNYQLLGP